MRVGWLVAWLVGWLGKCVDGAAGFLVLFILLEKREGIKHYVSCVGSMTVVMWMRPSLLSSFSSCSYATSWCLAAYVE